MAEIEAGTGYSGGPTNAAHAAAGAAFAAGGADGGNGNSIGVGVGVGNGDADGDEDPEPEVPEWQQKMRMAKQMLDDEDRAIAQGRIKAGEAPSMARAETMSDGRQIVRVSPPALYE